MAAGDLHPGEHLVPLAGSVDAVVDAVQVVPGQADMYNLTVAHDHTFAVGHDRVVVHNNNLCKGGGAYDEGPKNGGQNHHMPAQSVSPFSKGKGPVINMSAADHRRTMSGGSSAIAGAYRDRQAALIQDGLFREAQQLDIEKVRSPFGTTYDTAIQQMLDYTDRLLDEGR